MQKLELVMQCDHKYFQTATDIAGVRFGTDQIEAHAQLSLDHDLDGKRGLPFRYGDINLHMPVRAENLELVAFFEPPRMYRVTIEPLPVK